MGDGRNHHPLSENGYFSTTKHPVDLRLVCELEFVRCVLVEKTRVLYMARFSPGGPMKFKHAFFKIFILH